MRLFHFTSGGKLRAISSCGLTVGDVPTDLRTGTGKIGIWLTTSDVPDGHGLIGSSVDKARFRLLVDVKEDYLVRWVDWAKEHVHPETQRTLRQANGHGDDTWYVYFGHIPRSCIIGVTDMMSGTPVDQWESVWPEAESLKAVSYEGRFIWQARMLRDLRRTLRARQ